jgi:uncharacterized protein with PIN domain
METRPGPPCFLADAMLGRLAKWLRLLGYDTAYAGEESDQRIAARARAESRVVLTRDREMARRKGIRCLLVHSQDLGEQLEQVLSSFDRPRGEIEPRCPQCNASLIEISPQEARSHVPAYVFQAHRRFRRCPACERVYWPGSHWAKIEEMLARHLEAQECGPPSCDRQP